MTTSSSVRTSRRPGIKRRVVSARQAVQSLVTVRDMLRWTLSRLTEAQVRPGHGTLSLDDEAILLVFWALHLTPDETERWLDARLTPAERTTIAKLVEARCTTRQPAAYLTGEAWLGGVCFASDARALVPRSLIAEALDSSLAAYLEHFPRSDANWPSQVLDLCTGGGSLAVLAALRWDQAQITAADLSAEALSLAAENVTSHGLGHRIRLVKSNLFAALRSSRFDLILCNPPYVNAQSMNQLPPEFQAEPALALAGGSDGMDLIRPIMAQARAHLNDHGCLLLEIGHEAGHFERAFPKLACTYLPVEAGENMIVLIEAAALPPTARPANSRNRRR